MEEERGGGERGERCGAERVIDTARVGVVCQHLTRREREREKDEGGGRDFSQ